QPTAYRAISEGNLRCIVALKDILWRLGCHEVRVYSTQVAYDETTSNSCWLAAYHASYALPPKLLADPLWISPGSPGHELAQLTQAICDGRPKRWGWGRDRPRSSYLGGSERD